MASPAHYLQPQAPVVHEVRIKDSRFIAHFYPATTREAAERSIQQISQQFSDATHHCFAYRIGMGSEMIYRTDDAGEPAGTAGQPILQALEARKITNAVLVITRYFGGTKLGIGGLKRAYSTAAFAAIDLARLRPVVVYAELIVTYDYQDTGVVHYVVNQFDGKISHTAFKHRVQALVKVPDRQATDFQDALKNRTAGRVQVIRKN